MLIEAKLINSIFEKRQTRQEGSSTLCSRPTQTRKRTIGASLWTSEGTLLKESASQKIRFKLTESSISHVALQDHRRPSPWYQKIRDYFAHVTIRTDGKAVSLNIGSLCKRTQLSVASIFLKKFTGKLTLDFLEQNARKALQTHQQFEQIIQNARHRAQELGKDPEEKVLEIRQVLQSALKSRRLSKGVLSQKGETTYIVHRDKERNFTLIEKRELLGEGTYGVVYEAFNLATQETHAVKFAKNGDAKASIKNEYELLKTVHSQGHIRGVQKAPRFVIDLLCPDNRLGYVATKYDYNFNDMKFLNLTPMQVKLSRLRDLFNGLSWLHKINIVHCDIKPANCCSEGGEFQLADFGHARRSDKISPEQPLGVFTPFFTSESDQLENKRIMLLYCLHQIAIGKVKNPIGIAGILQSAIKHASFNIDRKAAKFTIASLLMKFSDAKLKALGISTELYRAEKEILKKSPGKLKTSALDLSQFKLAQSQMEDLIKKSIALCKRHDVYSLAVTTICILLGVEYVKPVHLATALAMLSRLPELAGLNPDLNRLLKEMLRKDGEKRPTIESAMEKFNQIIAKGGIEHCNLMSSLRC